MNCTHIVEEKNARWTGAFLRKCVVCNRRRFYAKKVVRCSACHGFVHKRCLQRRNAGDVVARPVACAIAENLETTDVRETVFTAAIDVGEQERSSPENSDRHSADAGGVTFLTTCNAEPITVDEMMIVVSAMDDREDFVEHIGPDVTEIESSAAKDVRDAMTDHVVVVENAAAPAEGSGVEPTTGPSCPGAPVKKSAAARRRARKKASAMKSTYQVDSPGEDCRVSPKISGPSAKEIIVRIDSATPVAEITRVLAVDSGNDASLSEKATVKKSAAAKRRAKKKAAKSITPPSPSPAVSVDHPVLTMAVTSRDADGIESTCSGNDSVSQKKSGAAEEKFVKIDRESAPGATTGNEILSANTVTAAMTNDIDLVVAKIADNDQNSRAGDNGNDGPSPPSAIVHKSAAARRRAKKKKRSRIIPEAKVESETTPIVVGDDVTVSAVDSRTPADIRILKNTDKCKSAADTRSPSNDDLFDRLRTSTNPWTIKLKDSEVFGYSPTQDYIDFIDEIESDEGLSMSFEIIVSGLAGHEMVKLVVSPDVEYLGSGDTYELAQKSAAFSFLKDIHLRFKE